jgi:hypothetical protein
MISVKNILTISSFESKVLWRNWFFRIVALLGIGFLTIFNLGVFSELNSPQWFVLANGWLLPYTNLAFIAIPQAAAVIFLATGLIKKDKKLDTNEVFFVRPISNLDYVLGKAMALFKLFFLLNVALLCIPLIVGLTSPVATVNPMAFVIYPLLTSIPTIIFTTGIAFLLVTVIRNQPISIVLLIGIAGVQLIYYFDKFSNILDFTAFRLSMMASEMLGFVDIGFAIWQRTFYVVTGIACLFFTAFLLDRLSGRRTAHHATALTGTVLLALSCFIMVRLWDMRQQSIASRQAMIEVNGRWTNVPNIDVTAHAIALEWAGDEIISTSDMVVTNPAGELLDTIYFSLNPELTVDAVFINDEPVEFKRVLQIVSVSKGIHLEPGEEANVRIQYHGGVTQLVAHLEVDQKRYENAYEFLLFSLPKKYAFLEDDYVLLTKDVFWYPDTELGYNRESPTRSRRSFIDFELSVKAPAGKTAISQGEAAISGDVYQFKPEYPLPHISLVIGDYLKKEITVDSVVYSVFHYPKNDFFVKHLDQLTDTLNYLISDIANEFEDAQKLSYPFKRLQFVEVPLLFTAYNKIYESHQAAIQPETVFLPEEGGVIRQFDFRRQLKDMTKQAAKANQVLTDKQKQANVFNDLIRKVFTKQTGSRWVYEAQDFDNADYSLFPNYYDFNSGIASEDWALLNRSIATYLRNDKQIQNDYSREINGISFTEECNTLMRTSSITKILTEADFSKISKSLALKSQYLFFYLGQIIGESNFKSFLYDWVNTHQHQINSYEEFRTSMLAQFNVDVDPIIRQVYSETSQPAFEILDVQKYEVTDGDRKRYQVIVKAKNSGNSDGVLEFRFNHKNESDNDNDNNYSGVNKEAAEETPGRLAVIKQDETKMFGFVLDEKPNDITINTIISRNIPSVINMSMGTLSRREGGLLFDGERVVEDGEISNRYEVIVDNEGPGFTSFSPIEPTMLKTYLDNQKGGEKKYYGSWDRSYSRWLATTGSDFYGSVIRSAHFTRSGDGGKIATWTPELKEEGFYDIYVYMRGKNQNEFMGRDGDGRQFNYQYIIYSGDGTDNIKYNITNAESGWNYLGSYYFNKTGGRVSLTDECEQRTVYADAVKWVRQ